MDPRRLRLVAAIAIALATASCTAASSSPAATAGPSPSGTPLAASTAPGTPSPEPSATAAPTAPTVDPGIALVVDSVAVVVADGLRMRSQPNVSDDSIMFNPLLPAGTTLYLLSGPVEGSGYSWYEVAPVNVTEFEAGSGWVAAASRDGEAWLAPGSAVCPALPTDVTAAVALTLGERLACFGGEPITIQARLVDCNCDVDGGFTEPTWFSTSGPPPLLADPAMPNLPGGLDEALVLHLDPAGSHIDPLPMGSVVEVTGVFDHPAARACQASDLDGVFSPTHACRFEFAVTSLKAAASN